MRKQNVRTITVNAARTSACILGNTFDLLLEYICIDINIWAKHLLILCVFDNVICKTSKVCITIGSQRCKCLSRTEIKQNYHMNCFWGLCSTFHVIASTQSSLMSQTCSFSMLIWPWSWPMIVLSWFFQNQCMCNMHMDNDVSQDLFECLHPRHMQNVKHAEPNWQYIMPPALAAMPIKTDEKCGSSTDRKGA